MSHPYVQVNKGPKTEIEGDRLVIGRQSDCDVIITDTQASRNHCVIERAGQDWVLRDLDSRNGTRVNGQLVSTVVLGPKDVITIGMTQISFHVPEDSFKKVDVLSADDLVEVEPGSVEDDVVPLMPKGLDYEAGMEKLAEALPDQGFQEWDIELINARGGMVHGAGKGDRGGGRRETVDLFRLLLLVCFRSRASDIHVEARHDSYQARLRIDGTMVDVMRVPPAIGVKLTTLVKVLGDIDIAHRNTIQEGHFTSMVPNPKSKGKRRVDYRVSFAPALHGQKLVVRILDTANAPLRLADLQLPAWMFQEIGAAIRQDSGMVMVSGPTGSGKTTSLYALVRSIETNRRNVVTIEDPVEIQIDGVTQIPVDEAHDKGFSQLLRSVLRQDPDVLLVGEIRDSETSRIAMQAAITGHLVFSTVHTKDTIGTIFRLLDLGVEPYLVAQGLHVVLAQRLVRRLCPYCKKPYTPTPEQRAAMGAAGEKVMKLFTHKGCVRCLGTGFNGRQAFFELLVVNDALRDCILSNPSMTDIQKAVQQGKFIKLQQAAYQLVADGVVPYDEVERVVGRER